MIRMAVPLMLLVGACAQTGAETPPPMTVEPEPTGECDAKPVQDLIGKQATDALGQDALRRAGAKTLRVLGPDTAATMDFRTDRLNLMTDAKGKITQVTCG